MRFQTIVTYEWNANTSIEDLKNMLFTYAEKWTIAWMPVEIKITNIVEPIITTLDDWCELIEYKVHEVNKSFKSSPKKDEPEIID